MLIGEYDYEMDIAVQREEAAREAEAKAKETLNTLKGFLASRGVSVHQLAKETGLPPRLAGGRESRPFVCFWAF